MFLLRAAFWLAAVAVLMPREPDLGFGVPDAAADCAAYESVCEQGQQWLSDFRASAVSALARVRADIEEAQGG